MLGALGRTGGGLVRILRARDVRRAAGLRHAGGEPCYRQLPKVTRRQVIHSELLSGFMWFWILWHFWHSPGSVLGHFPYPDSSEWTDEELGIPPDDEE
ncbi:NADH dehydrogenase [ubiquinone] 1 beta subcomplex subunit 2, mitochondrial [Malaclemys terrapin pileata]|uniref:NADH dehydrogenase [ubiquinone] 1 beta subcomplex subunit 2, mitochondrial n=1 Tax=Malaclemys terrapin pileata TaxID=2991368 RepID=UPI0023A8BEBB|nr:NADH dehydrogenase [ubiquinone] 1 beta subcomplex subunit 2, mitochondrial [Malaclemys terrapin pileata]